MNVLFVHGLYGFLHEQDFLELLLARNEHIVPYEFRYRETLGQVPLEKISARCVKSIKENKIDVVIGLSMGGIIAAHALEHSKTKCKHCITICSPWYGSNMAKMLTFMHFKGIDELKPHSEFLIDLASRAQKSKVNYYTVYNPLDLMVFPGKNALVPFAKESKAVPILTHFATFFSRRTIFFCEDMIRNLSK